MKLLGPISRKLIDSEEVAEMLGCSARHVRRMAQSDKMPRPIRLGALVRWDRDMIAKWISRGCPSPSRSGGAGCKVEK